MKKRKIVSKIAKMGMKTSLLIASTMIVPLCFIWVYEPKEPVDMKARLEEMKRTRGKPFQGGRFWKE